MRWIRRTCLKASFQIRVLVGTTEVASKGTCPMYVCIVPPLPALYPAGLYVEEMFFFCLTKEIRLSSFLPSCFSVFLACGSLRIDTPSTVFNLGGRKTCRREKC